MIKDIVFRKKGGKYLYKDSDLDIVISKKRGDMTYSLVINGKTITRDISNHALQLYAKEMFNHK